MSRHKDLTVIAIRTEQQLRGHNSRTLVSIILAIEDKGLIAVKLSPSLCVVIALGSPSFREGISQLLSKELWLTWQIFLGAYERAVISNK